jgi:stress response protein SCP2
MVSQSAITLLIELLLKYERNRTRIDVAQATLTIYDNDNVTPLTVFSLKDHMGNPSVAEVCERLAI